MLLIAGTDTRKDPEGRFFESWLILGYFGTTESTDLHGSIGSDSFPCDSVCSVVKPRKSRQKTEDRCQRADLIVKELWDFKLRQSGEVQYRSKCLILSGWPLISSVPLIRFFDYERLDGGLPEMAKQITRNHSDAWGSFFASFRVFRSRNSGCMVSLFFHRTGFLGIKKCSV